MKQGEIRSQVRALVYLAREVPAAGTKGRWRVWTPSLPPHDHEARGSTVLRALFAAHAAVRRWLAFHPAYEIPRRGPPGFVPRPAGTPFLHVTGADLTVDTDPELIVFATLFSNVLDAKRIAAVLEHHTYPLRWTLFAASHLKPVSDEMTQILLQLARSTATPTRALEVMVGRSSELAALDIVLVSNPNATRAIVERVSQFEGSDPHVLWHPLLPVETLRRRYEAMDPHDLRRNKNSLKSLATNPRCPRDIVTELALHPDLFIRAIVARRPDLPPSVRDILAQDESPRVRAVLAGLPWPPPRPPRVPPKPIHA